MAGRVGAKAEKERDRLVQDRLQSILSSMLKEEDNKYCVDCDNKGPRWASWNLGIFLCIRCAGIHRNLGVHISKVKSVNLDSWTLHQVSSMQQMGNSKARSIYESSLPSDFRRPQTDSAVEAFVRQKYEKKKFLLPNWEPSKPPDTPVGWSEEEGLAVAKAKTEVAKAVCVPVLPARSGTGTAPAVTSRAPAPATKAPAEPPKAAKAPQSVAPSAATDLLGLLGPSPPTLGPLGVLPTGPVGAPSSSSASCDLLAEFGDFASASPMPSSQPQPKPQQDNTDLFGSAGGVCTNAGSGESGKMSRDSIMALFGPSPGVGAPPIQSQANGMFQQQQQQQQQQVNMTSGMNLQGGIQGMGGLGALPGFPQQLGQVQGFQLPTANPFLASEPPSLPSQLANLNLGAGQGQASLWQ